MPKKPEVHDIDKKSFTCGTPETIVITGYGFTSTVTVTLKEKRYEQDHVWNPETQDVSSTGGGTQISVTSTPSKSDGSPCGGFPTGDLTVTVTNSKFSKLDDMPFNVSYHS